jgi:hypothetical protein
MLGSICAGPPGPGALALVDQLHDKLHKEHGGGRIRRGICSSFPVESTVTAGRIADAWAPSRPAERAVRTELLEVL